MFIEFALLFCKYACETTHEAIADHRTWTTSFFIQVFVLLSVKGNGAVPQNAEAAGRDAELEFAEIRHAKKKANKRRAVCYSRCYTAVLCV